MYPVTNWGIAISILAMLASGSFLVVPIAVIAYHFEANVKKYVVFVINIVYVQIFCIAFLCIYC